MGWLNAALRIGCTQLALHTVLDSLVVQIHRSDTVIVGTVAAASACEDVRLLVAVT